MKLTKEQLELIAAVFNKGFEPGEFDRIRRDLGWTEDRASDVIGDIQMELN